jgi:hypothetical protein
MNPAEERGLGFNIVDFEQHLQSAQKHLEKPEKSAWNIVLTFPQKFNSQR